MRVVLDGVREMVNSLPDSAERADIVQRFREVEELLRELIELEEE